MGFKAGQFCCNSERYKRRASATLLQRQDSEMIDLDNESEALDHYQVNLPAYHLPSCQLRIPRQALEMTLELFRSYSKRKLEACCFWYGLRDESGGGQVRAIVIPKQQNTWGNYTVTADTMADVANHTRCHGWRNLSQVHTHPGRSVRHSWYDDENANSQKALSIIIPNYGVWKEVWPRGIGIHEYQNSYWHLLTDKDAAQRTAIVTSKQPIMVDLR